MNKCNSPSKAPFSKRPSLFCIFVDNLPFTCSFENYDFCEFDQIGSREDELDWNIQEKETPTDDTGPSRAYDGTYYAYLEASGSDRIAGDRAM